MVRGRRAGREGDGDGDESGQEGEAKHDAGGGGGGGGGSLGSCESELMADGDGAGDLYCNDLLRVNVARVRAPSFPPTLSFRR